MIYTDNAATTSVGKAALDAMLPVLAENIDMLSLSGHKFHGPKGIGALYCRNGVPLSSFIEGGAQERNKRGGSLPPHVAFFDFSAAVWYNIKRKRSYGYDTERKERDAAIPRTER